MILAGTSRYHLRVRNTIVERVGVPSRTSIFGDALFITLAARLFTEIIKDQFFAMSEPPASDPKKPELKDLLIAVKDIVNWHDLGLHLDLPESKLASIATHPDIEGHRRMMLSEWLQFDPEASWEKLATALSKIGKNVIAVNVRREYVNSVQSPEQEAKRRK